MNLINENYNWFNANRDTIIYRHHRELALITGKQVKGYFVSDKNALDYALSHNMQYGSFIIQPCLTEQEETVYIY